MNWPASKANRVLAALLRIGWSVKRQSGTSHRVLQRSGYPDYVFAFHATTEDLVRALAAIDQFEPHFPYRAGWRDSVTRALERAQQLASPLSAEIVQGPE